MKQSARRAVREGPKNASRSPFAEMQARIDALEIELAAAREREAAAVEVLGVISASAGNLVPVFDAILKRPYDCVKPSLAYCGPMIATVSRRLRIMACLPPMPNFSGTR